MIIFLLGILTGVVVFTSGFALGVWLGIGVKEGKIEKIPKIPFKIAGKKYEVEKVKIPEVKVWKIDDGARAGEEKAKEEEEKNKLPHPVKTEM